MNVNEPTLFVQHGLYDVKIRNLFAVGMKCIGTILPLLAVLLVFLMFGNSALHKGHREIQLFTEPVYFGEAFEHDIQPSPFILYWGDFQFDFQWWNSFLGGGWYPTCGGCVVMYDPIWNPWNKMNVGSGFPIVVDSTVVVDSVQKTLPLLSPEVLDSVSVVQNDSMPARKTLRQRWKHWKEERKRNKQNNRN